MTSRAVSIPPKEKTNLRQNAIWCVISICLALMLGMFGLPLINVLMAHSSDFKGQWTCTSQCPKTTAFELSNGAVYLQVNDKRQQVGYWKWQKNQGLAFQALESQNKAFKWVFFTSRTTVPVHRQLWTGAPVVCLDGAGKWCYTQSTENP